jgi:ligand-binding sensor domain-containing protein
LTCQQVVVRKTYSSYARLQPIKFHLVPDVFYCASFYLYLVRIAFAAFLILFSCRELHRQDSEPQAGKPAGSSIPGKEIPKTQVLITQTPLKMEDLPSILTGEPETFSTGSFSETSDRNFQTIPASTSGNFIITPRFRKQVKMKAIPSGIPEEMELKPGINPGKSALDITSFNKIHGLKHNIIRGMAEDKSGHLWLATYGGGISRFDGRFFYHYTENEGISSNTATCVLADRKGNIWFGTYGGGVFCFDGKDFKQLTSKEGLPSDYIFSLLEDQKGRIWIGTDGAGVFCLNGSELMHLSDSIGLGSKHILSMAEDDSGNIWIGTKGGLSVYNGQQISLTSISSEPEKAAISALFSDKEGNMWAGTSTGSVCRFRGSKPDSVELMDSFTDAEISGIYRNRKGVILFSTIGDGLWKYEEPKLTHFSENDGIPGAEIWTVFETESQNHWIGTENGISRISENGFRHFMPIELSGRVNGIAADGKNTIWLGTEGQGLIQYDGREFRRFSEKNGLPGMRISCLMKDKENRIWIGTSDAGVGYLENKRLHLLKPGHSVLHEYIISLSADNSGAIWIGTFGGGIFRYDGITLTNFYFSDLDETNEIYAIMPDKSRRIWFATGSGIVSYNGNTFSKHAKSEGFTNKKVNCIAQDSTGTLWFGSYGEGVFACNGNRILNIREAAGLSSNFVLSALRDKSGNVWLGTRLGLNRFHEEAFRKLSLPEGIATTAFSEILSRYHFEDGFLALSGCFQRCKGWGKVFCKDGSQGR